jgi:phosphate-selective porin OprO/OprP
VTVTHKERRSRVGQRCRGHRRITGGSINGPVLRERRKRLKKGTSFAMAATLVLVVAQHAVAGVEELTFGGRLMWDQIVWSGVEETQEGAFGFAPANGTEIRRARLFASGRVYSRMRFKFELDFAGSRDAVSEVRVDADGNVTGIRTETVSEIALKDAYIEFNEIAGGAGARIGHFKEPFLLNELTSSKYISFLERASLDAFAPSRNSGAMLLGERADRRIPWQAGVFLTTNDQGLKTGDDGYSFGARLTGLVIGEDKADRLVHLGASVNYRVPEGEAVRFRSRPEIHLSDRLVDTGAIAAESVLLLGAELASVLGPAHFTGEYVTADVSGPEGEGRSGGGAAGFSGFYVQAGYFLTGEHRIYDEGAWARNRPRANFLEGGGFGAWELLARYSSLDLSDADAGVDGGKMDDITIGLNWYPHANARVMFNYIMSSVDDVDGGEIGTANAFAVRYQLDF